VAVGPRLAETRHRGVDHTRIEFADTVVINAQLFHHAGPEILGNDVGLGGELHENLLAARVFHVDAYAFLVAVEHREAIGLAVDLRFEAPRAVALGKILDLDDVGAHVPQHHGAVRAR